MSNNPKDTYAPIPTRAMADEELTAEQFRVLMAVAAHDRFNRNGKGCNASHPRLAALAKCHLKSLSRSLKALAERGYLEGIPSPFNKRQRAYRVVYNDADRAIMTSLKGNNAATCDGGIGNKHATETDPIGNKDFHEPEQNQGLPDHKRFSETEKRFSETDEESSVETAPSCDDAKNSLGKEEAESNRRHSNGNILGIVQTFLKSLEGKQLTEDDVDELNKLRPTCEKIEEEYGQERIGYWAQRLATDIDILLDESDDDGQGEEPFFAEDRAVNGHTVTTARINGDGEFVSQSRLFTAIIGGRA